MSTVTDPIADLLARVRNGARAQKMELYVPYSKLKADVVRILKSEGYISDFAVEGKIPKTIKLKLKYQGKKSVIEGLRRLSTPGLRRYVGATEIPRVRNGLGVAVVSTSEGLMTGNLARKKNIGGELLCSIW